jgi:hypothetical protein
MVCFTSLLTTNCLKYFIRDTNTVKNSTFKNGFFKNEIYRIYRKKCQNLSNLSINYFSINGHTLALTMHVDISDSQYIRLWKILYQ